MIHNAVFLKIRQNAEKLSVFFDRSKRCTVRFSSLINGKKRYIFCIFFLIQKYYIAAVNILQQLCSGGFCAQFNLYALIFFFVEYIVCLY